METKERLKKITEFWFLTEPLLFAAYCTHELTQNNKMKVPFRTGMRFYSPKKFVELNNIVSSPNELIYQAIDYY